jgi:hypothetical protein
MVVGGVWNGQKASACLRPHCCCNLEEPVIESLGVGGVSKSKNALVGRTNQASSAKPSICMYYLRTFVVWNQAFSREARVGKDLGKYRAVRDPSRAG